MLPYCAIAGTPSSCLLHCYFDTPRHLHFSASLLRLACIPGPSGVLWCFITCSDPITRGWEYGSVFVSLVSIYLHSTVCVVTICNAFYSGLHSSNSYCWNMGIGKKLLQCLIPISCDYLVLLGSDLDYPLPNFNVSVVTISGDTAHFGCDNASSIPVYTQLHDGGHS